MDSKIKTHEIDGNKITVYIRSPRQGIRLKALILSIMGTGFIRMIFQLIQKNKGDKKPEELQKMSEEKRKEFGASVLKKIDMEKLIPAFSEVFSSLTPESADNLVTELSQGVFVNGADISNEDIFNTVFEGKDSLMFKVLGKVLVENLQGFFSFLNTSDTEEGSEKEPVSEKS